MWAMAFMETAFGYAACVATAIVAGVAYMAWEFKSAWLDESEPEPDELWG